MGDGPPPGWRVEPLERVATIQTGLPKGRRKLQDPLRLPYLRVANVQDGYLDLSELKTIEVERARVERYRLWPGDVLLTEGGDLDKLGRGTVWRGEREVCLHQNHVFVVRPDPKQVLSSFLSALTGSDYGKRYFLACGKQTTNLASINSRQLKAFPVLVPPVAEQRRIVEILTAVDQAIATARAVVQQVHVVKTGLMQELLTRGVPGRHATFVPTELGWLPAGWAVTPIGEVAERMFVGIAQSATHAYVSQGGVPIVRTTDVGENGIARGRLLRISEAFAADMHGKALRAGDVLTTRTGVAGKSAVVPEALDGAQCFTLLVTRPGERLHGQYLCHVMNSARGRRIVARGQAGGVQQNLNVSVFRKALVGLPPREEQVEICAVLDEVYRRLAVEERRREALVGFKAALMSVLLRGEVRVRVEEGA